MKNILGRIEVKLDTAKENWKISIETIQNKAHRKKSLQTNN